MKISEDTLAVIDFLDKFSEEGLRKKQDIASILEISASRGDFAIVNQIVFTGKSVRNLYSKLKRTTGNNSEILQKQLAASADELRVLLDKAIDDEYPEIKERFEVTYLKGTSGCLANLIDLSHDLTILKEAQAKRSEIAGSDENELQ